MRCVLSVLLIAFLGFASSEESEKQHITYYLDELCDNYQRMIPVTADGFNSSVILKSSKKSQGFSGECSVVFIIEKPGILGDGFLVTSQYYKNNDDGECGNYVDFYTGSKRITRWCNSSDIYEFGSFARTLTMNLNTTNDTTLDFEISLTVYSKPIGSCLIYLECKHENHRYCVATELKCDGIRHCIEGEDQRGCSSTLSTIIPSTASTSTLHSTSIPVTNSTTESMPTKITVTTPAATTNATVTTITTNATETTTAAEPTTNVTQTATTPVPTTEKTRTTANFTETTPSASTNATHTTITTVPTTIPTTNHTTNPTTKATTATSHTTTTTPITGSTPNSTVTTSTSTGTVTESRSTSNVTTTEVPTTAAPMGKSNGKIVAIVLGIMFAVAILIVIAWFGYKHYKRQTSYDRL